ncbi:hypothetical protein PPACK8108_LOCUS9112 [Phakopsora pachyrhizi]|uniref:Uncharacterized protein n=1 Tax=Phakopsora pachyrhizi TaxID=170000 RepID=A0AAV0AZE0_PHAPC|nr:hypothetical protein PPACK8108_LOCUS9112 [Phakopsora pachyrhizi]
MPNPIEISASSMIGLLGAVEASKASSSNTKASKPSTGKAETNDEYNISKYRKGLSHKKLSTGSKDPSAQQLKGSNKGVKLRAGKDKLVQDQSKLHLAPSVEEQLATQALERKAKIYEATVRGQAGGLTYQQLESCPLDVNAKRAIVQLQEWSGDEDEEEEQGFKKLPVQSSSLLDSSLSKLPTTSFTGRLGSSSYQESVDTPRLGEAVKEDEDWIETVDEYGRSVMRLASELKSAPLDPQQTLDFTQTESASHLKDISAQYGPQTSFPILETPTAKRPTTDEPVEKYFDSRAERRQLGTGFYALSSNPEERLLQQEELRTREAETEKARASVTKVSTGKEEQLSASEIALEARKRQIQLKREEQIKKRLKLTEVGK